MTFVTKYVRLLSGISKAKHGFLVDESLGIEASRVIRASGWNVLYVGEVGLIGKADEDVYAFAWHDDRIILTHDKDFLNDRRSPFHRNPGVIVLPGATRETPGLVDAIFRVLRIVGPYRDAHRATKLQITEDGIWSTKGFAKGQVTVEKRRVKFGQLGEILEWVEMTQ